mmetsp:Transcript_12805/g.30360  ORF Transcript_12805/g.30360 Transcript_12805/m.30360 type:complete len:201 (+) Transcript_12805:378-980(+)
MPVVVPFLRSTVTVKAVLIESSLLFGSTMSGICNLSKSSPRMPTQMTPLVYRTMKAIFCDVACSAASIRSPSFSRSSSSRTTKGSPRLKASSATGMLLNPSEGESVLPPDSGNRGATPFKAFLGTAVAASSQHAAEACCLSSALRQPFRAVLAAIGILVRATTPGAAKEILCGTLGLEVSPGGIRHNEVTESIITAHFVR